MRKKTAVTALSVLALAPALAACGSSGSSSAASSGAGQATTSASATSTATAMVSKAATGKTKSGANGCTPVSKKGNCYQPKEFCAKTQHGMKGIDADGKKIVCKDSSGRWVWQLA